MPLPLAAIATAVAMLLPGHPGSTAGNTPAPAATQAAPVLYLAGQEVVPGVVYTGSVGRTG